MPLYLLMDQQEEVWSADCASILSLKSSISEMYNLPANILCHVIDLQLKAEHETKEVLNMSQSFELQRE